MAWHALVAQAIIAVAYSAVRGSATLGQGEGTPATALQPVKVNVLTWNSGGGQPTPEYLGGAWEDTHGKMFSDIEQLTGVLLLHLADCDVKKFGKGTPFEKYQKRYQKMWDQWLTFKKDITHRSVVNKFLAGVTPKALTAGVHAKHKQLTPAWATANGCKETGFMLGAENNKKKATGGLGLCPERWPLKRTCKFDLGNEACFPLRDGLPVYGKKFMELLRLDEAGKYNDYYDTYVKGLLNKQTEWPAKGCEKPDKETPVTYMKFQLRNVDEATMTPFSFEKWTQVWAWDLLVVRCARMAETVLNYFAQKNNATTTFSLTTTKKTKKFIDVMSVKDKESTIQGLIDKAAEKLEPDVIFLQEREEIEAIIDNKDSGTPFGMRGATTDTAIFVRSSFTGIDEERTKTAEEAWSGMLKAVEKNVKDTKQNNIFSVGTQAQKSFSLDQVPKMTVNGKAPKWVEKNKKLETIVVTQNNLLLLSVHADGDGYFAAQYLHMAAKMFDMLKPVLALASMIIGMDTNVQPGPSTLSYDPTKGLTFKQFISAKPANMKIFEPAERTVLKVRSFVQTQFSKIGKNDEEKKDMIFYYDGKPTSGKEETAAVENKLDGGEFGYDGNEFRFYPRNEWPVDHFMVHHTVEADVTPDPNQALLFENKNQVKEFAEQVVADLVTARTEVLDRIKRDNAAKAAAKAAKAAAGGRTTLAMAGAAKPKKASVAKLAKISKKFKSMLFGGEV